MEAADAVVARRLERPRVDVLGPVAVRDASGTRALTGRPARLLVALAVADSGATLDQLADVVWAGDPPPTHRPALHVHLGTVRRELGRAGAGSILRSANRYALDRDSWDTDAAIAAALLDAARADAPTRPAAAASLAEQALALWRGAPCAVDGEIVDVVAASQLDAQRRDGEELLVECLLAAGDARRAESSALAFVAAEPLREHRWGQLLRARYLAGRTADALATYQDARMHLRDALGIDPGRDLRGLEAAALTHDRARLHLPARAAPVAAWTAPTSAGTFVGRAAAIERVAVLIAGGQPVLITGAPGVGKSRFAVEVVGRLGVADHAWLDVRDAGDDTVDALGEWARQHPDGVVVLDNGDASAELVVDAFAGLRRNAPTLRIVVTSRVRLAIDAAVEALAPLDVPAVDDPEPIIEATEAVVALRAALAELAPSADVGSRDAARICHRAGGLPLALRLVADAARALPVTALVERTVAADEIDAAVASVLATTSETARAAFADLALVGGGFDADLGSRLTTLPPARFEDVVIELVDHGLVQARPAHVQPYSMLEPIRDVADRLLSSAGRRGELDDRHANACIARARDVEGRAVGQGLDLAVHLEVELPRVRRALAHLAAAGDAERALTLVCRLEGPLYVLGWWAEKIELFDAALAIDGAPTRMRARAHAFRARPGPMHLFDLGHAERAEAIAASLDADLLLAFTRSIRAVGLWWSGDIERAMELSGDAAARFADAGRTLEWSEARKFLGVAMVFARDAAEGIEVQHDALAVVRRSIETPFAVAHALAYLGHCHRMLGDDDAALASWSEALAICRQVGNRGTAIHIGIGLADLLVERGDVTAGLEGVAEALDLLTDARAWTYEPWAWTVALRAHTVVGNLDSASACARRAVDGLHRVPAGETVRLAGELAHLALARGDGDAAARLLGVVDATDDRREMPFRAHTESARVDALGAAIERRFGARAAQQRELGRRRSIGEAAGGVLVP